jgi:thiamine-monophosphate kinase
MDERSLLQKIALLLGPDAVADDCAVIDLGEEYLVFSTDMLHEETDFPTGMTEWQMGWMAAAATLSDIASMGAEPLALLLAAGLDRPERLVSILEGARDCCERHGCSLAGGDIDHHAELTLVTSGIGRVEKDKIVRRTGAAPGDLICITGVPGSAQAGFAGYPEHRKALLEPEPQVRAGRIIAAAGATCMMDVSDGLALSLHDLLVANRCGFAIEAKKIPVPAGVPYDEALEYALYGGGDLLLLFCLPPERILPQEIGATVIGRAIPEQGVFLDTIPLPAVGYEHEWK